MTLMARMYGLTLLSANSAWYLLDGSLSNASDIDAMLDRSIAEFAPLAATSINAFGIPEHMIHAPIGGDWVKYNEGDNQGTIRFSFLTRLAFIMCRRAFQGNAAVEALNKSRNACLSRHVCVLQG